MDCVWSFTGGGCSTGDTSHIKVSTETRPSLLCLQELKVLLLLKSIPMQPMAPGFRYPHGNSDLWLLHSCLMSSFSKFCSPFIDFVDWRVCGADARGFTGTQHSWWGKQKPLAGYLLLSVLGTVTTCLVYLACVFSFCRQSCQRSTAGQKRS